MSRDLSSKTFLRIHNTVQLHSLHNFDLHKKVTRGRRSGEFPVVVDWSKIWFFYCSSVG